MVGLRRGLEPGGSQASPVPRTSLAQAALEVGCPASCIPQLPPRRVCRQGQRRGSQLPRGPAGENVKAFFSRVAALAFEQSVLQDLERRSSARLQVGDGDLIRAYRRRLGAGEQASGLQSMSTILCPKTRPFPYLTALCCPLFHHSDLRPVSSWSPPASSDSLPGSPCPPGSLLMGQAGHPGLHGRVLALALLVCAFARSVPPPGMRPGPDHQALNKRPRNSSSGSGWQSPAGTSGGPAQCQLQVLG